MAKSKVIKKDEKIEKETIPDYDFLFEESEAGKKKGNYRFFRKLIKLNRKPLIVSAIAFLLMNSPDWVRPVVAAEIVNVVASVIKTGTGFTTDVIKQLAIYFGVLLFFIATNVPATIFRWKVASKMLRSNSAGIKCSVVRKLQSLSITYSKDMQSGKVQSKFLKDTDGIDNFMNTIVNTIIPAFISFIVSSVIAIYKNGYIALCFLFIVPANVFVSKRFGKIIGARYRDLRLKSEQMSVRVTTMLDMYSVTKSHGLEQMEIDRVNSSIKDLKNSGIKADTIYAKFGSWMYVVSAGFSTLCLIICTIFAIWGEIEVGDILLYQSLFSSLSGCVSNITNTLPQISSGNESLNSVAEIMNVKDIEVNTGRAHINSINGYLTFNNVSYNYPDANQQVVKNFSLDVKSGECIAFVGASGSGKSTIMNLIIGLLVPTSGELLIDGKNINTYNLSEYRHCISVVPQNSILFKGTIKENITYGLDKYADEDVERVAELANLNEFVKDLPNGLNTEIGEHGDKLSGGQKQRVTIARALIRNPQILILDEATSALDNISEYHVQKAISSSIAGRTTFIVAHRLSTIRNADRIVVMENGSAVEIGNYDELMAKKGKFYQLKQLNELNIKTAEEGLNG